MEKSSRLRALGYVLPICAGLAAGVGSSLLTSWRASAAGAEPGAAPAAPAAAGLTPAGKRGASSPAAARPDRDPAALAQRMAALEEQVAEISADVGGSAEAQEAEATPTPEERAASERHFAEEMQAKLRFYASEAVDAAWAEPAAASLQGTLRARAGRDAHGGEVQSVACRSTNCVARLRFPSYEAARMGFQGYVTDAYEVPCATSATLPEPADPDAPYEAEVLFDSCQRQ